MFTEGLKLWNEPTDLLVVDTAKTKLRKMFDAGVEAVLPRNLIESKLQLNGQRLCFGDESFAVRENIYLVGIGKAVAAMAPAVETVLGNRLKRGIISAPKGSVEGTRENQGKHNPPGTIEYWEGAADNQPDAQSLATTERIIDMVEALTDQDTLIVLISGGGSALLCKPIPSIDLLEKREFCKKLQNAGADITELNTVRTKLSMVKGGGLARMAYPANVISFILSDIIGDPIHLISSGPTVCSTATSEEVAAILEKYRLRDCLEGNLKTALCRNDAVLNVDEPFKHVKNVVIGNNSTAIEAAKKHAESRDMWPVVLRNDVKGNVREVALAYAKLTRLVCLAELDSKNRLLDEMQDDPVLPLTADKVDEIYNSLEKNQGQIVMIGAGEPSVLVEGRGKGGRNQELAFRFACDWYLESKFDPRLMKYEAVMLSGGTDGQDGPTDAAGAYGYRDVIRLTYGLHEKLKRKQEMNSILSWGQRGGSEEEVERLLKEGRFSNIDLDAVEASKGRIPATVLQNNDTYNFYSCFRRGRDLIKTGLTGTNVMDLHIVYITRRKSAAALTQMNNPGIFNFACQDHYLGNVDSSGHENEPDIHLDETLEGPEYLKLESVDDNLADLCSYKKRQCLE